MCFVAAFIVEQSDKADWLKSAGEGASFCSNFRLSVVAMWLYFWGIEEVISDCSLSDPGDSSAVGSECACFLGGGKMGVRMICRLT